MMNDEKKLEDYLFDPSADPEGSVLEIERRLRTLRYDAAARPLPTLRMPRPRRFVRRAVQLLAAAAVLAMVIVGVSRWMWTWPAGRPWNVSGGDVATLSVGSRVHPPEPMLVRVARIGWMRVAGGSEVTLLSTRTGRHRLEMTQGRMHLRVWAPPGSVRIDTPSGEVIDLGCEFVLDVSRDTSRVEVLSGWVQLENSIDEVLVPAGATSEMRMHRAPTVPVYRDAPSGFRDAVRELESSAEATAAAALDRTISLARPRDALTLLHLVERRVSGWQRILERAAELFPPLAPGVLARARRGDRDAIWDWMGELPLPRPKSWRHNWRDRLPLSAG